MERRCRPTQHQVDGIEIVPLVFIPDHVDLQHIVVALAVHVVIVVDIIIVVAAAAIAVAVPGRPRFFH